MPWIAVGLAAATLIIMGGGALWLITGVQERSWMQVVIGTGNPLMQTLIGLAGGLTVAFVAWWGIASAWMRPLLDRYAGHIGPLMPGKTVQLLVSVCAGAGEELLFRGALQHWLGIPFTAILFVGLHGYLDPRDRRVLAYGVFLTVVMLVFGLYAEAHGLIAPMVAHAAFDAVLIHHLVRHWRTSTA